MYKHHKHTRARAHTRALWHRYESTETPLLRLVWNKQDPNYLATIVLDSPRSVSLSHGTASRTARHGIAGCPSLYSRQGDRSRRARAGDPRRGAAGPPAVGQCHRVGAALVLPHLYRRSVPHAAGCATHFCTATASRRNGTLAVLPPGTIDRIRSAYGTYDTIRQPSVQTLGSARRHTL